MDRCSKLVAAALLLSAGPSFAFYANLSPPTGWTAGVGAGGQYAAAAGRAIGNAQASANFTGRLTQIPAGLRYASNAGRFAARAMWANPALGLGIAAASWLAQECLSHESGSWVVSCLKPEQKPPSKEYIPVGLTGWETWSSSPEAACNAILQFYNTNRIPGGAVSVVYVTDNCTETAWIGHAQSWTYANGSKGGPASDQVAYPIASRPAPCPPGWTETPAGCVNDAKPKKVTQEEFEQILEPKVIPDRLPFELPGVPLPVELPTINPSPETPPRPQPLIVPQGDPVPVPNSNPQRWEQPQIRIDPANDPSNPWRVNLQPENQPVKPDDPVQRLPYTPPLLQPPPKPGEPPLKPEAATPDLCEKHPEILACQVVRLDDLEPTPLPNKEKTLTIEKDKGWSTASASCPAPKTVSVLGIRLSMPFTLLCDFALGIKPLLIAFAWLSAALTFMGLSRKD